MRTRLLVLAMAVTLAAQAHAADTIQVGMLTTLSGPGSPLGVEVRDGFALAQKHLGSKLGGLSVEVVVTDDALNPDMARRLAERMIKRDRVDVMTGISFSNVMLAVGPSAFESQTLCSSPNAGPSQLAGAGCTPSFFNVTWQNDTLREAMGKHVADTDFSNALALAPHYPAGKDAVTGLRRFYKGKLADEVYTTLNQVD